MTKYLFENYIFWKMFFFHAKIFFKLQILFLEKKFVTKYSYFILISAPAIG